MKKIAVTGGSGGSGRFVIRELLEHGYDCVNLDLAAPREANCPFIALDMCHYEAVYEAIRGCDAIVHFAGNPMPDDNHIEAAARFSNNTVACFNIFNAARAHGIRRVVWSSSETIYGFPFVTNRPPRLPVDEELPDDPQNGYAISKAATERFAELMASLYGMTIIGFRFSNILYDDPDVDASYHKIPSYWDDVTKRQFNLWGYIDARDCARASRMVLESDLCKQPGAHVFSIAASDSIMNRPSRDVVAEAMPDVPLSDALQGRAAFTDCSKAKRVFGFEPAYHWPDVLKRNGDGSPKA